MARRTIKNRTKREIAGYIHVVPDVVPFEGEQFTERGERVYTVLTITANIPGIDPIKKVIEADPGMGFTEEWIEDTIQDGLKGLALDFPDDEYYAVRHKPNVIALEYKGAKGPVN